MLKNASFLAIVAVNTAENELSKVGDAVRWASLKCSKVLTSSPWRCLAATSSNRDISSS